MPKTRNGGPTLKQAKFAQAYLETGNATEAADKTYNANNRVTAAHIGSENVKKPAVIAELKRISEKWAGVELTEKDIRDGVAEIATDKGARRPEKLRALELLAKINGMVVDKREDVTPPDAGKLERAASEALRELKKHAEQPVMADSEFK